MDSFNLFILYNNNEISHILSIFSLISSVVKFEIFSKCSQYEVIYISFKWGLFTLTRSNAINDRIDYFNSKVKFIVTSILKSIKNIYYSRIHVFRPSNFVFFRTHSLNFINKLDSIYKISCKILFLNESASLLFRNSYWRIRKLETLSYNNLLLNYLIKMNYFFFFFFKTFLKRFKFNNFFPRWSIFFCIYKHSFYNFNNILGNSGLKSEI